MPSSTSRKSWSLSVARGGASEILRRRARARSRAKRREKPARADQQLAVRLVKRGRAAAAVEAERPLCTTRGSEANPTWRTYRALMAANVDRSRARCGRGRRRVERSTEPGALSRVSSSVLDEPRGVARKIRSEAHHARERRAPSLEPRCWPVRSTFQSPPPQMRESKREVCRGFG